MAGEVRQNVEPGFGSEGRHVGVRFWVGKGAGVVLDEATAPMVVACVRSPNC